MTGSSEKGGIKVVVSNRKARHEYRIDDRYEAGMQLTGSEVKSLREGKANLQEAYCKIEDGEVFLVGCHIAPFSHAGYSNHEPTRRRKLLLHRREIQKLKKGTNEKGYTIVPLKIYFKGGFAKLEIGLAKGKKSYDKRQDIAERDSKRRLRQLSSERSKR